MKKLYILLLTIISLNSFAQKDKDYSRYYNSWRLGLNIGAAWQTADYRSRAGIAGGLTLEKGFAENATNFFSFAIRGRYLAANTYGMDYNRNYGVSNNPAYNGTYDPKVNFLDSVTAGRQYVYDNYKTTLYEGSLELQVSFNRLRERTHVILNLWGGVGITSYRAKSDLLDGNGKQYDFSKVDSSGNRSSVLSSYNSLIDKKYESYAYGSRNGNLITFSPSAGIGLGYQFSPGFSLLLEYKVTFPQGSNADLLDGKLSRNSDAIAGSNDYYHYAGINFLFTLRGKKKTTTPKDETVYTNTVVPVEPVVPVQSVTPTASVAPQNTVATTVPVTEPAPVISYITPPVNGQVVAGQQYKIAAQILNVSNANQIQLRFNGTGYNNFLFNPQTHILEFNTALNVGSNSIQIMASNGGGTDSRSSSVVYELPRATGNPPTLTIINPVSCPANSEVKTMNMMINATNVPAKNNIVVKINHVNTLNFYFNASLGKVTIPLNLLDGNNSVEIVANNAFGTTSKDCYINYSAPKQAEPLPMVSYVNPAQPGLVSALPAYTVTAQVLNVSGQNAISVYYNGLSTPFTYNAANKQVSFAVNLNMGSNAVSITANNSSGEDTKTTTIVYQKTRVANTTGLPPVVNLVNPATTLNSTTNSSYSFKLGILNVSSKNDISVVFNGVPVSVFSYDPVSKEIDLASNLIIGNNTLVVKASNTYGTDSRTIQVNYQLPQVIKNPPVVTITKPAGSPANTNVPNYTFMATVSNVPGNGGLVVKFNGLAVTGYSYNGAQLSYNAVLVQGNNTFEVSATNADGSDSKNVIVNFKPKTVPVPPVVNYINPSSQLNATDNLLYNFKLSVLNVASSSDIEVLFNGAVQTNFTFNSATKELDFQSNLIVGNNTLIVKGTNVFGSDSKQVDVTYTPHAEIKHPPLVTFISPASMVNVQDANYHFEASVTNVPTAGGLVVTFNGNVVSNYTYDGASFGYDASLNTGTNALQITATNSDGSNSKTAIVNYRQKTIAVKPVPVVTIVQPVGTPTVTTASYDFQFTVTNTVQNQLQVSLNGTAVTSYTFASGQGGFTSTLTPGNNVLAVKAVTPAGSDTKTETVFYYNRQGAASENNAKFYVICHHDADPNVAPQTINIPYNEWPEHQAHGDTMDACPSTQNIQVTPRHIPTEHKANEGQQPDTLKAAPTNTPRRPR